MRRWLRSPPVAAAMLLVGLLGAGPAAARQGPDHLHVDLSLVGCGTLQASGFKLPESARLELRFVNAATGATPAHLDRQLGRRRHHRPRRQGAAHRSLHRPHDRHLSRGGQAVRLLRADHPRRLPAAVHRAGPGAHPAGLALGLLVAGGLLVAVTAYRGRHATRVRTS
jgi:hypothetical protein